MSVPIMVIREDRGNFEPVSERVTDRMALTPPRQRVYVTSLPLPSDRFVRRASAPAPEAVAATQRQSRLEDLAKNVGVMTLIAAPFALLAAPTMSGFGVIMAATITGTALWELASSAFSKR